MVIAQEMSRRKQAEMALRKPEEFFRTIFEQAAVGVAEVDAVSGVLLHVNQRYCQILGIPAEQLVGKTWMQLTHPDDLAVDLGNMQRLNAGEIREFSLEKRLQRQDGSYVWVNLTVSPMWQAGEEPSAHIAIVEDISDRKQTEEALRRSEDELRQLNASLEQRVTERTAELMETNTELTAFAHTVSHDLRAPLRAMEGFAVALAEDYGKLLDENGRKFIQHIIDSALRMDRLVADLLAYSRLGRERLSTYPINLNSIVDEALTQLAADIKTCNAEIDVAESMVTVLGHRSTLVQIVTNLLSNAMKFVAPSVRPEVRLWTAARDDGSVRLWIEDHGIGIAPEYQERIFGVFERLHAIDSYPGTGIGLAVVARACERLGGRCGVESQFGQGSRFWVELPRADGSPE